MKKYLLKKRNTNILTKLLFVLIFFISSWNLAFTQCTGNTSQYPSGAVTVDPDGNSTQISSCNFLEEFSIITGIVSGEDYEFTVTASGYITIEQGGVVLNHGVSPVSATAAASTDITVYWNTDASCAQASNCEVTTVQCSTCTGPPAPTNDACAGALPITNAGAISGTTTGATNVEALTPCSGGTGGVDCAAGVNTGTIDFGAGIWYVYTSGSAETVTIELTGFDTELQIFTGSCGSFTCVAGDDDSYSGGCCGSQVCFESTASFAPVDYYIYVDGHGTSSGAFDLTLNAMAAPVDLVSFDGQVMDKGNKITWATASEENTEVHILEKSTDGINWREINRVEAVGFSAAMNEYQAMDNNPTAKAYYRLQSLDFDGKFEYSDIIILTRTTNDDEIHNIYPNPAGTAVNLDFTSSIKGNISMEILNINGQVVQTIGTFDVQEGMNTKSMDVSTLNSGVYMMRINTESEVKIIRFVKE